MARGCSPKGVVKKHNLYNKQPKDWGRGGKGEGREGEGRGRRRERGGEGKGRGRERGAEGRGGEGREGEGRGGEGEGRKKGAGRGGGVGGRLYVSSKGFAVLTPPKCETLWSASVHCTDPPLCVLCVVCPYHFGMFCSLVVFLREREREMNSWNTSEWKMLTNELDSLSAHH